LQVSSITANLAKNLVNASSLQIMIGCMMKSGSRPGLSQELEKSEDETFIKELEGLRSWKTMKPRRNSAST